MTNEELIRWAGERSEETFRFIEYAPAKNCKNVKAFHTCLKCGKCGRKFNDMGALMMLPEEPVQTDRITTPMIRWAIRFSEGIKTLDEDGKEFYSIVFKRKELTELAFLMNKMETMMEKDVEMHPEWYGGEYNDES